MMRITIGLASGRIRWRIDSSVETWMTLNVPAGDGAFVARLSPFMDGFVGSKLAYRAQISVRSNIPTVESSPRRILRLRRTPDKSERSSVSIASRRVWPAGLRGSGFSCCLLIAIRRPFLQLQSGPANPSIDGAGFEPQGLSYAAQRPAESKPEHHRRMNACVEFGQLLLHPRQALHGFGVGSAWRGRYPRLPAPCPLFLSKPVVGAARGHGPQPGVELLLVFQNRNRTNDSHHGVLYHVQAERFVAARGPPGAGIGVVEPAPVETRERLGISRSDRGCQVLNGLVQWKSSRGCGSSSRSILRLPLHLLLEFSDDVVFFPQLLLKSLEELDQFCIVILPGLVERDVRVGPRRRLLE